MTLATPETGIPAVRALVRKSAVTSPDPKKSSLFQFFAIFPKSLWI
jgi:hypothetical protein